MNYFKQYGRNPAENYERFFVPAIADPAGRELVELAGLQSGERVLDAGCGTGVIARLAAERVGPGRVTGLDVHPAMLAVARASTPENLVAQWHEASVESIPLPDDTFDVVICQLVLQFVTDKAAALREMRRVLAPNGRLVLSVVGPIPPVFAIMRDAFARHAGPHVANFVTTVFSMHDPAVLRALADEAGFADASVVTRRSALRLPPPKEFLAQYQSATPLAILLANASDDMLSRIESDVEAEARAFVIAGQLECVFERHVLLATK